MFYGCLPLPCDVVRRPALNKAPSAAANPSHFYTIQISIWSVSRHIFGSGPSSFSRLALLSRVFVTGPSCVLPYRPDRSERVPPLFSLSQGTLELSRERESNMASELRMFGPDVCSEIDLNKLGYNQLFYERKARFTVRTLRVHSLWNCRRTVVSSPSRGCIKGHFTLILWGHSKPIPCLRSTQVFGVNDT